MKIKQIIISLLALTVIAGCMLSLLFVSDLENQRLVGKIFLEEQKPEQHNQEQLTLLEKIAIYAENKEQGNWYDKLEIDPVEADKMDGSTEAATPEQTELGEQALKDALGELQRLAELGIDFQPADLVVQHYNFQVKTYMDRKYRYVILYEVNIKLDDGAILLRMEKDSGKLIEIIWQMYGADGEKEVEDQFREIADEMYEKERIAKIWGEYLGEKKVDSGNEMARYGEDPTVTYDITLLADLCYIRVRDT